MVGFGRLYDYDNISFEIYPDLPFEDKTYLLRPASGSGPGYIVYEVGRAKEFILNVGRVLRGTQISFQVSIDGGVNWITANPHVRYEGEQQDWQWKEYKYSYTFGSNATHIKVNFNGGVNYDPILLSAILQTDVNTQPPWQEGAIYTDISYGSHERHKLDIYLPAGSYDSVPFVIYIHGGGWGEGDKSGMAGHCMQLTTWGYAAVSINYRLTGHGALYNDMLNDIYAAIQYLKNNASTYKLRTDKAGIAGHSAGGHLSLLYAYKVTNSPIPISVVMSLAGPTDFTDPNYNFLTRFTIAAVTGVMWWLGDPPAQWIDASPITHVSYGKPYTVLTYGTADTLVPYSNGTRLQSKLSQYSVPHQLITIQGGDHIAPFALTPELINPFISALS